MSELYLNFAMRWVGTRRGERDDIHAIETMMQRLRLTWSEDKLLRLRREARHLVERERLSVQAC